MDVGAQSNFGLVLEAGGTGSTKSRRDAEDICGNSEGDLNDENWPSFDRKVETWSTAENALVFAPTRWFTATVGGGGLLGRGGGGGGGNSICGGPC